MRRTQIYLTDEQGRLLERRSQAIGRSISDLIRAAIDLTYSRPRSLTRAQRVNLARQTAGAWKDFGESGADYVDRLRGSRRLSQLHRTE